MDFCACPEANCAAPRYVTRSLLERDLAWQNDLTLGGSRHSTMVDAATLRHDYRYLSENLSLPCVAWYGEPTDEEGEDACTVMELIDPVTGLGDEFNGIFCKVRKGKRERSLPLIELELSPDDPNHPLVEHYWDSFWHRKWP